MTRAAAMSYARQLAYLNNADKIIMHVRRDIGFNLPRPPVEAIIAEHNRKKASPHKLRHVR